MKILILSIAISASALMVDAQNVEHLLLGGWKFQKGAQSGAENPNFDDSKWQSVTIPHDWAISGPFDKEIDKQVVAIEQNGELEATESLPWIGEGWYRNSIEIPDGYSHAELIFDGAMAEPKVYVEGKFAGYWAYGYTTFALDITPYLPQNGGKITPGKYSVAVHLKNREESNRWYPGAGLYRPVRLSLSQDVAVKTFGIFARTTGIEGINSDGTSAKSARITVNHTDFYSQQSQTLVA